MIELLKRGDRVRHETRTDWGLGEVLDDQQVNRVRILFEDEGLKTFDLGVARIQKVSGEEARSDYLSALVKQARRPAARGRTKSASPVMTFSQATKSFLDQFTNGFQDPKYLRGPTSEREYKVNACDLMRELLAEDQVESLLHQKRYDEICSGAKRVINKTNLIHHYEKIWLFNAISSDGRAQLFAKELSYLVCAEHSLKDRFERFTRMLYHVGAAKWTIATYFFFLAFPDTQIFVKPEVTKHAAKLLHLEIDYRSEVNWTTYALILRMAEALRQKLSDERKAELMPRDMIDVQSFIWLIGPGYSMATYGNDEKVP